MSIKVTITKHVYIDKWALQKAHRDEELVNSDFSVLDGAEHSSDYAFHLCPLEVTVEVPSLEAAQLMELAGCENALAQELKNSMARMNRLQERIEELKALPVPLEVA